MVTRGVWRFSDGSDELLLVDVASADPEGDPGAADSPSPIPALSAFGVNGTPMSPSKLAAVDPDEAAFRIERWLPARGAPPEVLEAARAVAIETFLLPASGWDARVIPPRGGTETPAVLLRTLLLRGLRTGMLRLYRIEPVLIGGEAEQHVEPQQPTKRVKKTWIEIVLVDEAGWAVPNERYRLELSDGSVREGWLNHEGYVRLEGIDPGDGEVTFPDLDEEAWERVR